ncbi:MAG: hypothetical protein IBX64_11670 [Actinobacteria bacterium]|nr:hypothetical protein [Actinomycetota bacterium]
MEVRFKRGTTLILAMLLFAGLVAGAYAANPSTSKDKASSSEPTEKRVKNPSQEVGKNWEIKGSITLSDTKPQPIKTLTGTVDPAEEKALIEQRPKPSKKGLLGPDMR